MFNGNVDLWKGIFRMCESIREEMSLAPSDASNVYMFMSGREFIDERAYELLYCQLGLANEEKAGFRKQVNELIARLKAIEESNKENSKALVNTINELSATVENYRKEMELMRKQLKAKDEVNRMLANEISNLRIQLKDSRKHRFGRTSEQRSLLDNRNIDRSAMEKSEYDGS